MILAAAISLSRVFSLSIVTGATQRHSEEFSEIYIDFAFSFSSLLTVAQWSLFVLLAFWFLSGHSSDNIKK